MPTFNPPTTDEGPAGLGPLFYRYKLTRGQTVINENGAYRTTRWPTGDELAAATAYYLGGHVYQIDATTAAALTAAGYGSYIT